MDRTSIGDFHQFRPGGFGHVAVDRNVTGNLADIVFFGVAIRTVLRVDLAVGQPDGEAFGVDPLALGIEAHRHGCTSTEGGKKIVIGAWPRILTTNRNRLIRHEQMAPGPYALQETPAAGLAHLNNTLR